MVELFSIIGGQLYVLDVSYALLATDLFVPEDDMRSVMAATRQNSSLNLNQLLSLPHYERECLEELGVPYHYSESK